MRSKRVTKCMTSDTLANDACFLYGCLQCLSRNGVMQMMAA
ncbi:hypothetical protein ECP029943810_4152 [Escherichia coli P0299438.10]|uniref:Uncharacterized protein n=1 Tax=Klebsiella pneumoniae TaxID=573 RepID=A0A7S5GGN4_KLEPN|nr:hypothetical protein CSC06_4918 [Escherichia coli]EMX63101.1 hypothetical protein ECENVIRA101_5298 [Escherichia coli Envira 10/1]ENA02619.1 hypothetical protein ECP02999171_4843 [Escherichia coli P0299917.1]ENB85497.1 hypothetical protein ECP029943810_4152 [Escherichia coli P0299438.10]ENC00259.1 hypothetical protein ECP02994384_4346 [Escherichia coli P0299438.4]ENC29602.1 hypothetical protein ECP029970676_4386 [Escherichia coli P02997067.6]QGW58808.1 hypothetical protein pKpnB199_00343 [K